MIVRVSGEDLVPAISGADWRLHDGGFVEAGTEWDFRGIQSPFDRFYVILEGSAVIEWPGNALRLRRGDAALIPLDRTFRYRCPRRLGKFFLHLTIDGPDGADRCAGLPAPIRWRAGPDLLAAIRHADPLHLHGACLAAIARRLPPAGPDRGATRRWAWIVAAADGPRPASLRVAELAAEAGLAPATLSRRFRAEVGLPLKTWLDRRLARRARRELLADDRPIAAVAHDLGFDDEFYFSRFVRRHVGMAPSAYRRAHRG